MRKPLWATSFASLRAITAVELRPANVDMQGASPCGRLLAMVIFEINSEPSLLDHAQRDAGRVRGGMVHLVVRYHALLFVEVVGERFGGVDEYVVAHLQAPLIEGSSAMIRAHVIR